MTETSDPQMTPPPAGPPAGPLEAPPAEPPAGVRTRTRLSVRWLRKLVIFLLVLVGFGIWGLYDALVAYPNRGENTASYRLFQYLEAADEAHGLTLRLGPPEGSTPGEHREQLGERRADLQAESAAEGARGRDASEKLALLDWYDSLAVLGRLSPERVASDVDVESPRDLLNELETEWTAKSAPKPLAAYDIPVQWVFVIVGLGGGSWLALHMLRVASKTYRWDPATLALTLPGGETITPDDVAEFDKRKWDKFLFFFKIKPDHASLGGREIKLDLYQYTPLEDWAVAMHRHARPEDYADENAAADAAEAGSDSGTKPDEAAHEQSSDNKPA
ncbi:MAG: hypothetical protein AAGF47_04385 [Planctomycetota bacterium]